MQSYFELYDLPINFHPDAATVKSKYYELSKRFHPDRYAQGDSTKMLEALTMAAQNNKAYKTLGNRDATMAYVLRLNNLIEDEEKYPLPPSFLMEMMDINEAVSDFEAEPENTAARTALVNQVAEQFDAWESAAAALTLRFDSGNHTPSLLLQIKDMYFRKKYLLRIQERIDKFAAR